MTMARRAIDETVDLVVVAGGDGTVRVVCAELAGTGIPVAVLPAGTGNLLARNLGISLDLESRCPNCSAATSAGSTVC